MNLYKRLSFFVIIYLRFFAKLQLKKIRPVIIGIGGSSGKTSLASIVNTILSEKHKVRSSEGKNSETGIPLTILGLKPGDYRKSDWLKIILLAPVKFLTDWDRYDFFIAEMGIDSPFEPKNMSYLLKIIKPHVAVITNISLEHSQYFDQLVTEKDMNVRRSKLLDVTAEQENLLLKSLPKNGIAIINLDDRLIKANYYNIKATKIKVSSLDRKSDFYLCSADVDVKSTVVHFIEDGKHHHIKIGMPLPLHYPFSFLLALSVVKAVGLGTNEAIEILEKNFVLPAGRMTFFEGIKDTTIIDSTYNNATLQPIMDLLLFLKVIAKKRRKIAILGDMRELGSMSKYNHEEVAKRVISTCDYAILIGPLMKQYAASILSKKKFPFKAYKTYTEAKDEIVKAVKPKDIILIKGSQNNLLLERAVELLLKNKKDRERLCRRGSYWDMIRRQTP